jgi:transposase
MFVRKKKNRSGHFSVNIVDKSSGRYNVVKNFGVAKNETELSVLLLRAEEWIKDKQGIAELDFDGEFDSFKKYTDAITGLRLIGLEVVIGHVFDEIGFNKIKDEIFRFLCIYRVSYPASKLKTTEYLARYHHIYWEEDQVYRYLDKLYNKQKNLVQEISYKHTMNLFDEKLNIVFYDVTTIYFEIDEEDELRKTGFSKEGRHQNPQIVLGLLVSEYGYPLTYSIFEGNKFEGHTIIPVIEGFKQKYNLPSFTIVADAGLLSNENLVILQEKGYDFILGARIKSESKAIKQKILSYNFKNGESKIFKREDSTNLIVAYSDKRAEKDRFNRQRGLQRLEKQLGKGRLSKANINNRGYNKYLKLEGEINISIDYDKYYADKQWDGLKGYITNSKLDKDKIIENYKHLWQIEKAFRISKTELKIRPVYHYRQRRIEAHLCITFAAYKIYKELERRLKQMKAPFSVNKAIEIAQGIFEIEIKSPLTQKTIKKTLLLTPEQKDLANYFTF